MPTECTVSHNTHTYTHTQRPNTHIQQQHLIEGIQGQRAVYVYKQSGRKSDSPGQEIPVNKQLSSDFVHYQTRIHCLLTPFSGVRQTHTSTYPPHVALFQSLICKWAGHNFKVRRALTPKNLGRRQRPARTSTVLQTHFQHMKHLRVESKAWKKACRVCQ